MFFFESERAPAAAVSSSPPRRQRQTKTKTHPRPPQTKQPKTHRVPVVRQVLRAHDQRVRLRHPLEALPRQVDRDHPGGAAHPGEVVVGGAAGHLEVVHDRGTETRRQVEQRRVGDDHPHLPGVDARLVEAGAHDVKGDALEFVAAGCHRQGHGHLGEAGGSISLVAQPGTPQHFAHEGQRVGVKVPRGRDDGVVAVARDLPAVGRAVDGKVDDARLARGTRGGTQEEAAEGAEEAEGDEGREGVGLLRLLMLVLLVLRFWFGGGGKGR